MRPMKEHPILDPNDGITLFYPHIPKNAKKYINDTLSGRWIGQGPKVDLFEKNIQSKLKIKATPVAVSSGTAALHIAYILSGIKPGDDVLCPIFTCTATNIPLLYLNANLIFLDISNDNLNINIADLESKITNKTVALSIVDYGGLPNNYEQIRKFCDKYKIKLIADCAHAIDGKYNGKHISEYADYTIFSFQAIKTLSTGDGGMLLLKNEKEREIARRLRWFGIDRSAKQKGIWENDLNEIGFKYQMNDISASIGLAALDELGDILSKRRKLYDLYIENLDEYANYLLEKKRDQSDFTPWLLTLDTRGKRIGLMNFLRIKGIETGQVHYRNDKYSIFTKFIKGTYPNMDKMEDNYLVLPLHTKMNDKDVIKICFEVKSFLDAN
tara:strand:+ start:36 stop:1187 length:1152 start_codon:yes stop_codon:yes gene_type:complete